MQSTQQEYPGKELRPVTAARHLRPPNDPAGKQTQKRFEYGGFPVKRSKLLRASPLDIEDRRQDQADRQKGRPDSPLPACRVVHRRHQEQNQGRRLRQNNCQMQSWKLTNQQRYFAQGRESKAAPAGKPITEIVRMVIAAEKEKEHQQDDGCSRFEESASEQALISQQHAASPGRKRRRCGDRAAAKLEVDGEKLRRLTLQ